MTDPAASAKIPWHAIGTFFTRRLTILQIIANLAGNMFGKTRIYEIMRPRSAASARNILDAILLDLDRFRQNQDPQDDITLVAIKVAA